MPQRRGRRGRGTRRRRSPVERVDSGAVAARVETGGLVVGDGRHERSGPSFTGRYVPDDPSEADALRAPDVAVDHRCSYNTTSRGSASARRSWLGGSKRPTTIDGSVGRSGEAGRTPPNQEDHSMTNRPEGDARAARNERRETARQRAHDAVPSRSVGSAGRASLQIGLGRRPARGGGRRHARDRRLDAARRTRSGEHARAASRSARTTYVRRRARRRARPLGERDRTDAAGAVRSACTSTTSARPAVRSRRPTARTSRTSWSPGVRDGRHPPDRDPDEPVAGHQVLAPRGERAACVADRSPEQFLAVNQALFRPAAGEGTNGLTDASSPVSSRASTAARPFGHPAVHRGPDLRQVGRRAHHAVVGRGHPRLDPHRFPGDAPRARERAALRADRPDHERRLPHLRRLGGRPTESTPTPTPTPSSTARRLAVRERPGGLSPRQRRSPAR